MSLFKKKSDIPKRRLTDIDARIDDQSTKIFRRNRTLTGTTSNRFNSANIKSDLESPRAQVHHLVNTRRKIFSVFSAVLLLAVSLWLIVSNFTAAVRIDVTGTQISKPVEPSVYEQTIQDYLSVNPMERFRFFLNQSALSDYITSKLPEVESIRQQDTVGVGVTTFTLNMRLPVAGWKTGDRQYYVDFKGIPFERNYYANPDVQVVDNSGISMQKGTAIASNKFLSFVGRVVTLSKSNGYTVTKAVIPANAIRVLEINLKECSYPIKLSIDRPAGEQVEDMVSALRYLSSNGMNPGYVDVRVSGKAFYK